MSRHSMRTMRHKLCQIITSSYDKDELLLSVAVMGFLLGLCVQALLDFYGE